MSACYGDLQRVDQDVKITTPACIIMTGPSMSGKTVFLAKLIMRSSEKMDTAPGYVLYCYNTVNDQESLRELKSSGKVHQWHDGWPDIDLVEELAAEYQDQGGLLLVLDDLGAKIRVPDAIKIFTVLAHHRKLTVILILHNFYLTELRGFTTAQRSATHFVIFELRRDVTQIDRLARDIGGNDKKEFILQSYHHAMTKKFDHLGRRLFPHLLIDVHPMTSDERLRICSDFFADSGKTTLYLKRDP